MRHHILALSGTLVIIAIAACSSSGGGHGGAGGTSTGGSDTGEGGDWCADMPDDSVCGNGVCESDANEEGCGAHEDPYSCPEDCPLSCDQCVCEFEMASGGCADVCSCSLGDQPECHACYQDRCAAACSK